MAMKILAGITCFNPNIERLRENISAIYDQVDAILLVDNHSKNLDEIESLIREKILLVKNVDNLGVARALNEMFEYATKENYDWVYTLDQDSVTKPGLIGEYLKYVNLPSCGLLTCVIVDRNFTLNETAQQEPQEIEMCITSASFCKTEAWKNIGGFDDWMFIDSVDFDYCLNLKKHGYKVYRIPYIGLLHEVGHGKNVRLFGKNYITYNENPFRQYYLARNRYYLTKKYPEYLNPIKEFLREYRDRILIKKFEDNAKEKIQARKRGIKDAKKIKR